MDAIQRLAREQLYEASVEIELDLRKDIQGAKPLLWVVKAARAKAREALVALVDVDPNDSPRITSLQNEIKIYRGIIESIIEIVRKGHVAQQELEMDSADQEELINLISAGIGEQSIERDPVSADDGEDER